MVLGLQQQSPSSSEFISIRPAPAPGAFAAPSLLFFSSLLGKYFCI
jgi:hypothetical protein